MMILVVHTSPSTFRNVRYAIMGSSGEKTRNGDLLIHDPRYWKSIEYRSSWYQFVVKTCLRRRM